MKKLIPIIFLMLYCLNIHAQEKLLYHDAPTLYFSLKYTSSGSSKYKNEIIKKLSDGNNKSLYSTVVNLSYQSEIKIKRMGRRIQITASLANAKITGNTYYREFDVADRLMPSQITFDIKLYHSASLLNTFKFKNVGINNDKTIIATINESDTTKRTKFSAILENAELHYTYNNRQNLFEKTRIIDEYYKAVVLMEKSYKALQKINLDNVDNVFMYQTQIQKNERMIREVKKDNYGNKLNLSRKDPQGLQQLLNDFEVRNNDYKHATSDIISRLHIIYYEKGFEAAARNQMSVAEKFYKKSVARNKNYTPALIELAYIEYNKGDKVKTIAYIKTIERAGSVDAIRRKLNKLTVLTNEQRKLNLKSKPNNVEKKQLTLSYEVEE